MESHNYNHITSPISGVILPGNGDCKLQTSAKIRNEGSLNSSLAQGIQCQGQGIKFCFFFQKFHSVLTPWLMFVSLLSHLCLTEFFSELFFHHKSWLRALYLLLSSALACNEWLQTELQFHDVLVACSKATNSLLHLLSTPQSWMWVGGSI